MGLTTKENKATVEQAMIEAAVIKNSFDIYEGVDIEASMIIDFPKLAKELSDFRVSPGSKAYDTLVYIDEMARIYRNDIGIFRAFNDAFQLNPTSGESIATSVWGKARVELASRLYEIIQTQIPGTKYNFAASIKGPIRKYFSDTPMDQKSYDEIVKQATEAGRGNRK